MIPIVAPLCMRAALIALFLCASVLSPLTFAQQNAELAFYKSEIPVRDQSASTRRKAAQQGLSNVIVRMSGSRQTLEAPAVKDAIKQVEPYILQSQYLRLDDPLLLEQGLTQKAAFLFSPERVRELLLSNTLPYWPTTRPQTLVWLVEDTPDFGRQFVSSDIAQEFIGALNHSAHSAGISLVYPLLDIDDLSVLSPEQVWTIDRQGILAASEKYDADVVLAGRVSQTSQGMILSAVEVLHRGQSFAIDTAQADYPSTAQYMIESVAQWLSGIYAIKQSKLVQEQVFISVSGVDQFGSYRHVLEYLRSLAFASKVNVVKIGNADLLLGVMTDVSLEKITTTLTLDRRIEAIEAQGASNRAAFSGFDSLRYDPNGLRQTDLGTVQPNANTATNAATNTVDSNPLNNTAQVISQSLSRPIPQPLGSYANPLMYRWLGK